MVAGEKVFGLINLESEKPNFFMEEHASVLQTFANQAGIAIEKAGLYQDALRAAERRAVLHRISQDIVRFSQNSEQIYAAIHEAAEKLMRCDVFVISLQNEKKGENVAVYTVEMGNRYEPTAAPADKGLTATVINEGTSIILRNSTEIGQTAALRFGSPRHVQSVVAVPLRINAQVIGMLSAQCYDAYAYDLEEQFLLEMLATHAATAIENNRLFELEQKRRQEAENLRQAASIISSTLDIDNVVKGILIALKQVIPYDNASVFFHEGDQLRLAMAHGYPHARELTNSSFPAQDELFRLIQETGRPLILEDAQKDPRFKNWGYASIVHGWMCIPLVVRGKVIGCITLDSYEPGVYNESIVETAMAFANQAAAGVDNARLFQEQSQRSKIIEALADIANDIATTREVLPALDQITRRALELLNANHVAIYLLQEDNLTLKTVTAHGPYRSELLSHTRKIGEGISGNVFLKGKPEIVNDTSEDPRRVIVPGTPERENKLDSLMSSPLILRGKTIGVINAWRLKENGLFNESELNFLVGIAHQVSICIESGWLFQETNRQAQEAAAIAEVGRDISSTLQLDTVLERIASYAMNLLQAETSAVYLADPATSTLRAIAALGNDSEAIQSDPLSIGAGILGNIALQNKGEIVNDTGHDARAITVKGTEQIPHENLMGVPILLKDKHTGLLAVWRSGVGTEFAPRELEFLTSLAQQAAVAIENARLYNEAQRRLKELEIINRVSTSLRMTHSFDEMLPILLTETLQLTNTPHGAIWLYDATTDQLIQRVASGSESKIKYRSLNPTDGVIGHTFQTGKPYRSTDLKNDPLLFEGNRESIAPGVGALYIPIQSTAGPVGVLALLMNAEQQIAEEINLLTILAEITGNSIHRAQLYEQSQRQVRRLTSLRDIDSAIASSFDLRLTLNILMDQTVSHLNVDAVNIGLYHPDLQSLTYLNGV
ncbi:MAG TPA: GAF domain-containing protein, partial [Anaerolineales bacterium]|nr:GAF domain-containing protein [Anaerolineales bacterium]